MLRRVLKIASALSLTCAVAAGILWGVSRDRLLEVRADWTAVKTIQCGDLPIYRDVDASVWGGNVELGISRRMGINFFDRSTGRLYKVQKQKPTFRWSNKAIELVTWFASVKGKWFYVAAHHSVGEEPEDLIIVVVPLWVVTALLLILPTARASICLEAIPSPVSRTLPGLPLRPPRKYGSLSRVWDRAYRYGKGLGMIRRMFAIASIMSLLHCAVALVLGWSSYRHPRTFAFRSSHGAQWYAGVEKGEVAIYNDMARLVREISAARGELFSQLKTVGELKARWQRRPDRFEKSSESLMKDLADAKQLEFRDEQPLVQMFVELDALNKKGMGLPFGARSGAAFLPLAWLCCRCSGSSHSDSRDAGGPPGRGTPSARPAATTSVQVRFAVPSVGPRLTSR